MEWEFKNRTLIFEPAMARAVSVCPCEQVKRYVCPESLAMVHKGIVPTQIFTTTTRLLNWEVPCCVFLLL